MDHGTVDTLFHPYILCFRLDGKAQCETIKRYGVEPPRASLIQAGQDYARVMKKGRGAIEFWYEGEDHARFSEPYP